MMTDITSSSHENATLRNTKNGFQEYNKITKCRQTANEGMKITKYINSYENDTVNEGLTTDCQRRLNNKKNKRKQAPFKK